METNCAIFSYRIISTLIALLLSALTPTTSSAQPGLEEHAQYQRFQAKSQAFFNKTQKFLVCHGSYVPDQISKITYLQCIGAADRLLAIVDEIDLQSKAFSGIGISDSFRNTEVSAVFDNISAQVDATASKEQMLDFLQQQIDQNHETYKDYVKQIKIDNALAIELRDSLVKQTKIRITCEIGVPSKRCLIGLRKIERALADLGQLGNRTSSLTFFEGGGASRTGSQVYVALTLPYADLVEMYLK